MPFSGSGAIVIDATTVSFLLMALAGALGLARGARAEAITLIGLLSTATIVTNEGMASRLVGLVNSALSKASRILDMLFGSGEAAVSPTEWRLIATDDQRLLFCLVFFILFGVLFYLAGSALGGNPAATGQRLAGGIVGVISGLAISLTFISFNQNYISRHSDLGELTVNIPLVFSPRPPEANPFAPYMPLVLLSAIVIIVGLAFITLARSRKAKP